MRCQLLKIRCRLFRTKGRAGRRAGSSSVRVFFEANPLLQRGHSQRRRASPEVEAWFETSESGRRAWRARDTSIDMPQLAAEE